VSEPAPGRSDAGEPISPDDLVTASHKPPPSGRHPLDAMARWTTHTVDAIAPWIDRLVGTGARWSGLPSGRRVVVGWLITRALMLVLLVWPERTIVNDVHYYFERLATLGHGGAVTGVLGEYPLPVVGLVGIPWLLSFDDATAYLFLFMALMLAFDAWFCRMLYVRCGRRQGAAVTLWLAAGPMMGPIMVTRFDIVPGILAGAAVLLLDRRPRLASALVTLGAAIKLWPVVLLPALAAPARTRWRVIVAALVTATLVVAACLLVGGYDRLVSPLQWQSDRGLQIESLAALPLMIPWSVVHEPWVVDFSRFITSEIHGPGDSVLITLASVASVLAFVAMALLWFRAWRRRPDVDAEMVGWIMLTTTGLLIVTNKVFSPQYLLWLLPVVLAMVTVAPRGDTGVRRFAVLMLTVGLLTHVLYPNAYALIAGSSHFNWIGVLLLVARDVFLVGFVVYAWRRAWRQSEQPSASESAPAR